MYACKELKQYPRYGQAGMKVTVYLQICEPQALVGLKINPIGTKK